MTHRIHRASRGSSPSGGLGWVSIVRLGLVQTSLGAVIVLMTATLNRVMAVELSLAAAVPGLLVGLHYAVQIVRPRFGYGSDVGGGRTRWVIGGMTVLAAGAILASVAVALVSYALWLGMGLAILAFAGVGFGAGAAGTSLLALMAKLVAPERRPAAAALVWMMMIAGFAVTATQAGGLLDPFSFGRLVAIVAGVSVLAVLISSLAIMGIERRATVPEAPMPDGEPGAAKPKFSEALQEVWADSKARRFTLFVFLSMLAYSAQDLVLEPYAGLIFGFSVGESTKLSGAHHAGVFLGMLLVGLTGGIAEIRAVMPLKNWTILGCFGSAVAMILLAMGGAVAADFPLKACVAGLGFFNGIFAVAAIGSMMTLAGEGRQSSEGIRMGVWGAAQAIAFGLGSVAGTLIVDFVRWLGGSILTAYGTVFFVEALLFLISAVLAARLAPALVPGRRKLGSAAEFLAMGRQS